MKNWMIFLCGIITGVVLTIIVAFIINTSQKNSNVVETEVQQQQDDGVKLFEEPGDIMEGNSFKVFQVIATDGALVKGKSGKSDLYYGMVYLLINREGKSYYDDEIVNVPKGKVVRQMGIYHYPTRDGFEKTVPIIEIVDK